MSAIGPRGWIVFFLPRHSGSSCFQRTDSEAKIPRVWIQRASKAQPQWRSHRRLPKSRARLCITAPELEDSRPIAEYSEFQFPSHRSLHLTIARSRLSTSVVSDFTSSQTSDVFTILLPRKCRFCPDSCRKA